MNIAEALEWADNFGPPQTIPPSGDAPALLALAAEVRHLRAAVAPARAQAWHPDAIAQIVQQAIADERERCASIFEHGVDLRGLDSQPVAQKYTSDMLTACAAMLRATSGPAARAVGSPSETALVRLSEGLGHLVACPMCSSRSGYALKDGSTYRWWDVFCVHCGRTVDECASDRRTQIGTDLPDRWPAADAVWNEAGAHANKLRTLLARYRDETPLGHQPYMISHQTDEALGRAQRGVR